MLTGRGAVVHISTFWIQALLFPTLQTISILIVRPSDLIKEYISLDVQSILCSDMLLVYSARHASITASPAWQHATRAVRRSLIAEELDGAGGSGVSSGSLSSSGMGSQAAGGGGGGGPPSACKTPQTPMRIQQLYSFGDGPILSEVRIPTF